MDRDFRYKDVEIAVDNAKTFFEKLMTVEELADAFGLAPQTIRNWVAKRSIPFVRVGGRSMFRKRSVEAWLDRKEFKPWR